jgi:hypothetical protein
MVPLAALVQVVEKTTRNALDIVDWLGLQGVGEARGMQLCTCCRGVVC